MIEISLKNLLKKISLIMKEKIFLSNFLVMCKVILSVQVSINLEGLKCSRKLIMLNQAQIKKNSPNKIFPIKVPHTEKIFYQT